MLILFAIVWAVAGMIADIAARRWARARGVDLPGDILFAIITGPFSAHLIMKFAREQFRRGGDHRP